MKLTNLKSNPNNPRIIKDEKFKKLVKSIKGFPEMMEKRPIICVTDVDGKLYPLGGNMRLKAIQELNFKEIPDNWVMLADSWTQEQRKEFVIKDNVGFGEWDWDNLANEWDAEKLDDWGLNVPLFNDDMTNNEDYEGLDQLSKLDKFLSAELKRMFLVYDNETFENVVNWFNLQQKKHELENHSQVILKLMENENI
jgi:ParB-like chromosome segregation protein Spo0J